MTLELWDTETRDLVETFATEDEARGYDAGAGAPSANGSSAA